MTPGEHFDPGGGQRRVLVVSAGMGAGHHAAADELVRRLRERGHPAERIDVLELGRPGQGRRLRATYAFLLRRLPWAYGLAMRFWARWPAPLEALTARGAHAYEQGLLREVRRYEPDVVVSVFNLASQALGRLRASGRLPVPVATYVPDPGPHPYWVHPGVDLHLTVLARTARALESYGARRVMVVSRVVRPPFERDGIRRADARVRSGLPAAGDIALVSGGSWTAGRVRRTATCLARSGGVIPVTLCGNDNALRRRLTRQGAGVALGWTDDMATVMAAADVLVDNAGGLTCSEALACGLPVILFRPLPGHGRLNAEALEAAGEAAYARCEAELISIVRSRGWRRPGAQGVAVPASGDAVTAIVDLAVPDLSTAAEAT
jgi:processive 1,2-diacylglycerol beta-glucosyltransferase